MSVIISKVTDNGHIKKIISDQINIAYELFLLRKSSVNNI